MGKRVKSSDVLDPNAVTAVELEGRVVGRYRPTGPNRWDDYELVREEGEVVGVKAGEKIQVEPLGARPEVRFRAREGREVVVLCWIATEEDRQALATGKWGVRESEQATALERAFGLGPKDDPRDDMLEYFLDVKSHPFEHDRGLGAAALLVQKLRKRPGE
jgi:hypothetical protein